MEIGRVIRRAAVAACAGVLLVGGLPAGASDTSISMRDSYFATKYVVITVGDAVTWRNDGQVKHTVTQFPDEPEPRFDSSSSADSENDGIACDGTVLTPDDCLAPGASFTWGFGAAGTYDYYCKAHGDPSKKPDPSLSAQSQPCGMCGRIVVREKATTPPPVVRRTPTFSARPTVTASPSATPSPTPSPGGNDTSGTPIAAPAPGGGGGGGGARATVAVMLIVALSGAAYWTWRRFLAVR